MKTFHETPVQFHINEGIGIGLANAAARKGLYRISQVLNQTVLLRPLTGDLLEDFVTLAADALLAHLRQKLQARPLQILSDHPGRTRIRVCGAFDYVIDSSEQRVWSEPSPFKRTESTSRQRPPWHHPFSGQLDNIDLLNPLCRPGWLVHVAARPGWFGDAFARHEDGQAQLFVEQDQMEHALSRVTALVWRKLRFDQSMVALRHQLTTALTLHIGPRLVSLAMRARLKPRSASLNARHLNLVWRHRQAYETMERENPRLLTALTAWLAHKDGKDAAQLADALHAMRQDLLASGLPPRAWRYLAEHGMKRLLPAPMPEAPWRPLLEALQTLNAARWPALPPRGFLRLLNDTAGRPDSYETSESGVAGWFWQISCDEASARKGDVRAYLELFDRIAPWAWLVREFSVQPDKNQRRKGIAWLCEMAAAMERLARQDDAPAWALWLQSARWDAVKRLDVHPLLSPHALLQEAMALHNCADSYVSRCREETRLLLSLRDRHGGKRVALACIERRGNSWVLGQVAGPCNRPVPAWVRAAAHQAASVVRYHHSQRPPAALPPSPDEETGDEMDEAPDAGHFLFQDP